MIGGFNLTTNFSNNNLAGLQNCLDSHDIHNMSDEERHHNQNEEDEDDDDEDDDDDDEEDSHLRKVNSQVGGRRKKVNTQ